MPNHWLYALIHASIQLAGASFFLLLDLLMLSLVVLSGSYRGLATLLSRTTFQMTINSSTRIIFSQPPIVEESI
ncbi:hypothetical protein BDQ12DRAFT_688111, partial [Crucibulum laeve]